jgi:hypothetical protein
MYQEGENEGEPYQEAYKERMDLAHHFARDQKNL